MHIRVLALAAAIVGLWVSPAAAIPRVGEPAPAATLQLVNGKKATVASFHGSPLYLNFFATWCGPCRLETPDIVRLEKQYAAKGLRVVGVDVGENAGKANGFVKEFGIGYLVALDSDTSLRDTYGSGVFFPIHVFIDRNGIVRSFHPGEMSAPEIENALRSIVR